MTARSIPYAVCSVCRAYSYHVADINKPCGRTKINGEVVPPCQGILEERGRYTDWLSCQSCNGTGYQQSRRCQDCGSSGWRISQ